MTIPAANTSRLRSILPRSTCGLTQTHHSPHDVGLSLGSRARRQRRTRKRCGAWRPPDLLTPEAAGAAELGRAQSVTAFAAPIAR